MLCSPVERLHSSHERDPEAQWWHFQSGYDGTACGEEKVLLQEGLRFDALLSGGLSVRTASIFSWWDSLKCQANLYKNTRLFFCSLLSFYTNSANAGHQWLPSMVLHLWSGGGVMLFAAPLRQGFQSYPIQGTDRQGSGLNKLLVLFPLTSPTKGGLNCSVNT